MTEVETLNGMKSKIVHGMFTLVCSAGAIAVLSLLAGCGPTDANDNVEASASSETPSGDSGFAAEWAALIEAAQAEGEIVIAAGSSRSRDHRPLFREFTRRFGVDVVAAAGSGSANVQRVLVERSRGRYAVDLSLVGVTSSERLREAGALVPLTPWLMHPEAVDRSQGWHVSDHVWLDSKGGYVAATSFSTAENLSDIFYNTDHVTESELAGINSWWDFLDPSWKGRTVAILEPSGDGKMMQWVRCWRSLGGEWFSRYLREAEPALLPNGSGRIVADGLIRGKFHVAFLVSEAKGELEGLEDIGLPVRKLLRPLKEGGGIDYGGSIAVLDSAPHPHATKLFLNWYLTREGQNARQTLLDRKYPNPSLRSDVVQGLVSDYDWGKVQQLDTETLRARGDQAWIEDVEAVNSHLRELCSELGYYGY